MSLPVMPSTHTWVQGGPILEGAGRNVIYASDLEVVWVWNEDTGAQVTDLRDASGNTISVVPIVNGWVAGVGVPNAVALPSFSVGQYGPHFPLLPVQSLRNAQTMAGPTDTAVAALVTTAGTATQAALGTTINVNSAMSLSAMQAKINTAVYGSRIKFQEGTYALNTTSITLPADGIHVDAMGATFTLGTAGSTAAWGVPAFDLLGRNYCTLDIGLVQYIGTRGDHTNANNGGNPIRGQAVYALGSGVYINGDHNYVRNLRTIDMPTPINLSSWDGTTVVGHYGAGNRIGRLECSGYDFGVLFIGQNNLVIDDIYAHDDHDDSSGANPTHAYYCTATSTFRATGVTIRKARVENNTGGHAFQLKNCDQTQLGPHSANNAMGLMNVIDCNDLSWTDMKGTSIMAPIAGNGSVISMSTVTNQSQRPVLSNTAVTTAANQDTTAGIISIQADDAQINNISVTVNHSASTNTGTSDVILRGQRGRLRGATLASVGAAHARGIAVLNSPSVSLAWKIDKPTVNGQRCVIDVQAGCSGTAVDYDPNAQVITGGGAAVTGATTDVYVVGSTPTMGKIATTSGLVLTGTATDIPGTTVTLTPSVTGKVLVVATFDCTSAAAEPLAGILVVDGTAQSGNSLFTASAGTRATVGQTWVVPLTAGSHTLKLQGQRVSGTATTHAMNSTHTGYSYQFVPNAN